MKPVDIPLTIRNKTLQRNCNNRVTAEAYWVVSIPEPETPRRDKVLHIDARTGKIIFEKIMTFYK